MADLYGTDFAANARKIPSTDRLGKTNATTCAKSYTPR